MSSLTQFRVRIWGCSGQGLPAKDRSGTSDPFLQFNFDNFKTFRTETIKKELNPTWKFKMEFFYETRYAHKLTKKSMKIDCFDYDKIGANDFIGSCVVDLHTLATGPLYHDMLLRDGGRPQGRVQFFVEMEQMSEIEVQLKSVEANGLIPSDPPKCDPYVKYYFSAHKVKDDEQSKGDLDSGRKDSKYPFLNRAIGDGKTYKTSVCQGTTSPSWPESEVLFFKATLREMLSESIILKVKHSKWGKHDPELGIASISLKTYAHPSRNKQLVKFSEPLRDHSGDECGSIEGIAVFKNIPQLGQMQGGKHTELGVEGGRSLLPSLPKPHNIIGEVFDPAQEQQDEISQISSSSSSRSNSVRAPSSGNAPSPSSVPSTDVLRESDRAVLENVPHIAPTRHAPKEHVEEAQEEHKLPQHDVKNMRVPMASPVDALPPGWERREDQKGRSYYVYHEQKLTQWEPPSAAQRAEAERVYSEKQQQKSAAAAAVPSLSVPSSSSSGGMPGVKPPPSPRAELYSPGSSIMATAAAGQFLQGAGLTASSGMAQAAAARQVPGVSAPAANPAPPAVLPPGWEQRMTGEGRIFYVDHNTRSTHWALPDHIRQQAAAMPQQGAYPVPSQQMGAMNISPGYPSFQY